MKNILFLATIALIANCATAQTPVLPIYETPGIYGSVEGAYYKDTFNDYDRFEGTWLYTNGNDTLKIVLEKKEMQYNDNSHSPILGPSHYEDILVGEYRYVENGMEKVNTLPNLQINYADPYKYNLSGGIIEKYDPNAPEGYCLGCNPGEIQVSLSVSEPNVYIKGSNLSYYFRHFTENGVEKLELTMFDHGFITHVLGSTSMNDEYSIPAGDYILVKQ